VIGWKDERDTLLALSAATGEVIWKQSYAAPRYGRHATGDEGLYSGHTATPEFDPATSLLYTLAADGELRCWNTKKQGELAWRKNLYDEYKMPRRPKIGRSGDRDYGYTTSPLVVGDWLIIEAGGERGTVVAFDKRTGIHEWESEHRGFAGHTGSVVPLTVEGVPCLAVLTLRELLVLRADEQNRGKTVATFPWQTDFANNILTPTVSEDSVIIGSYHTHHAIARIRLSLAKGAEKVWQAGYASYVGSPIVYEGRVYLGGPELYCLDWATGKLIWQGGKFDSGASLLLTKDERLIALGTGGAVTLVESGKRSPEKYTELSRTAPFFSTEAWPHVVLAGGRLLAKDRAGNVKCFAISR
jgi:outer membrane protein assembly factor BamB